MPITDKLRWDRDGQKSAYAKTSAGNSLSEVEALVQAKLQPADTDRPAAETDTIREALIPHIKGLEILKEGVYSVDLEKTIKDMLAIIKNMEAQLNSVLDINAHLEKDLNEAKDLVTRLRADKTQLAATISSMEEEIPSKRKLQIEIDYLIEERNGAQTSIREMKQKVEKMQKAVIRSQEKSVALEEEKVDLIAEVNFLESRLNAAAEQIKKYDRELKMLKGEKLAHAERIKALKKDLADSRDEQFKLVAELKKSKEALGEIHSALSDKKLQAKKSFYKGAAPEKTGADGQQ